VARTVCRCEARALPPCEVEELVQEALLVVWDRRATFDPERGRFENWVRGICRNLCRDARRRKRDALTADGVLEGTSPERGALRQLREEERKRVVTEAIEALPEQDQDVLYHRYVHELSRQAIAALLEVDVEQVRVRLQRASRHLKRALIERLELLDRSFFRPLSER
jgi:RNA polymerase sigma-70 factor (ECF subfamily)